MDATEINDTILRNQPQRLDAAAIAEALDAAASARDGSLEGRRLAAACALSDRWPMSVCSEVARALIRDAEPLKH